METVSALFPFALILVAFYFLIIRPARTRQRAALALQQQLAPGQEVVTTSGIYGRVVAVDDEAVGVEVSPGTTIRFAKAAVGRIVSGDHEDDAGAAPGEDRPGSDESR